MFIRWMVTKDLDAVAEIELKSNNFYSTKQEFIELLRKRNVVAMVAEDGDVGIIGFMMYELMNRRIHLLNISVHPDHRNKGVGKAMVNKLISKLSPKKRTKISIEVRERNLDGQLFLQKMKFKAVDVIRAYFEDSDEDAFVFHYVLPR